MQPVVIDLQSTEDRRDVVHRAVQALAEGGLVAFPTETVYGVAASALDEDAVCRLLTAKGRTTAKPLTLAIKSADEARDYAPDMCPLARRLARRCWPGPVTLVIDDSHPESLVRQLPPKVRQAVSPQQAIGLRVPGHRVILDVLRMFAGPLTLTSANRAGMPEATTAKEVIDTFGDDFSWRWTTGRAGSASPLRWSASTGGNTRCCGRACARADLAATLQFDGAVGVYGEHLPQPDGRNVLPCHARQAAEVQHRRIGGSRGAGDVGRDRRHVGRKGQQRGSATIGRDGPGPQRP